MAKKTFVLDTNILLADPNAIFSFQDNEIILPFVVLEELDRHKSNQGEIGLNAREVSRQLHDLLKVSERQTMKRGISLPNGGKLKVVSSSEFISELNEELRVDKADNHILAVCIGVKKSILVTNDMLLRVKADACGIPNQDYRKNVVADSIEHMYSGVRELVVSKETLGELWTKQRDRQFLTEFVNSKLEGLHPNEFVHVKNGGSNKPFLVRKQGGSARFVPEEYELPKVKPRNLEQRLAMDLLMDESINLVTIVGKAGTGKAQPLDSLVLTPGGWTKMGSVSVGDYVIGGDGKPTKVIGVFPQGKKPVYLVTFSDGSTAECCDEHLWFTKTQQDRDTGCSGKVRPLSEIRKTLRHGSQQKRNHSIPMVQPVEFNSQEIEIDPYVLGAMLGDDPTTHRSITLLCKDLQNVAGADYRVRRNKRNNKPTFLLERLERLQLLGKKSHEKFVPDAYKYNTSDVRLSVLQGLMDTAGTVSKNGTHVSFTSTSEQLANDVQELVWSFGGKAIKTKRVTHYTYKGKTKQGKPSYRLSISMPANIYPFRLIKKLMRLKPQTKYQPTRYIDKVELIGEKETQCILVNNKDHLYVTNNYIVTHNTLLTLAAGLEQVVEKKKYKSLLVCRPVQPLGKDIGFLPGSKEEKMEPWIAPIKDNLRFLLTSDGRKSKNSDISLNYYFDKGLIEVEAMTYIRGRSIADAYMIIDECFPREQQIATDNGKIAIGKLADMFKQNLPLPKALSWDASKQTFVYKSIVRAWSNGTRRLVKIKCSNREIECTKNHPFLSISGKYIPASKLEKGEILLTTNSKPQSQFLKIWNTDQEQMVLGSYLGNGSITNHGLNRFRLKILHGKKQKEYLKHKAKILNCSTSLIKENGFSKKQAIRCTTQTFASKLNFDSNKKHVSPDILSRLDQRGLAIWFMDNGTVFPNKNGARMSTCSFDIASQELFVSFFHGLGMKNVYHKAYFAKQRNKFYSYLIFNKNDYEILSRLIEPYVHPQLSYKIINTKLAGTYRWNKEKLPYGATIVDDVSETNLYKEVFDIEVEDLHNFVIASSRTSKNNSGIVVHNCQNLSAHELKTIITRVGEGTKIVLTGDVEQIDNMYVDSVSNGLAVAVERFKEHDIAGHITLKKGERSKLATLGSKIL